MTTTTTELTGAGPEADAAPPASAGDAGVGDWGATCSSGSC
ncbi:hypothetical protein JD79_00871 [Geodermatophilus normandii]|uniref:Uncharacterized protein n=1 Tax=Geodermatophilus normandii TaxID=1137989 RepID=A0A317QHJ8_9ACTN|nr:hypothetical protein [Geodermatophilus normandii]PWW21735.1 hypothetical protein JD79_00871 [Geodermatophilus normandii]